jgi:histidinol-phosphatase (PHP family)
MEKSCETAQALGLPSIAFTDHADFTDWAFPGQHRESAVVRVIDTHARSGYLDEEGYWECLERCRARYPHVRILSGVELGESHVFATEAAALTGARQWDRVLGSLHSLPVGGVLHYAPALLKDGTPEDIMRRYLAETLRMLKQSSLFSILAHIDYPMRAWPKSARPFDATDYEEEYRAVLKALAESDRVLEINTAGPWPAVGVVEWWREEGGGAVSFGSDAHEPGAIAKDFRRAAAMAEACGFRPGHDSADFWRR